MKRRKTAGLLSWILVFTLAMGVMCGTAAADNGSSYVLIQSGSGLYDVTLYTYNSFGLVEQFIMGGFDNDLETFEPDETIQVRYHYDENGFPCSARLYDSYEDGTMEFRIENAKTSSKADSPVLVRLYDLRYSDETGEMDFDEEEYQTMWSFLIPLLRYAPCYQNADFSMDGSDGQLSIRNSRETTSSKVSGYTRTVTTQEWGSKYLSCVTTFYQSLENDTWISNRATIVYYDSKGRVFRVVTQHVNSETGILQPSVQFSIQYNTISSPDGEESIDFGTIVQSSNEEQNGLSYSRYYYDASDNLTRSVIYTPYGGNLARERSTTTTRDFAPDGQLLREETVSYSYGELASPYSLAEYSTLWDALN